MALMKVKAAPGIRVPKERAPREYITTDVVEVPRTAYYLRRLKEGDLLAVAPAEQHSTEEAVAMADVPVSSAEDTASPAVKSRKPSQEKAS